MSRAFFLFFLLVFSKNILAQDIKGLIAKVRQKIEQVNDYEATGKMKTNVAFLKVPVADVNVYFKKPNKLKLKSTKGVSFIPKGAVSFNINNLLNDDFSIIDAGTDKIGNTPVRVAKLLPNDDNSDVVLSTIYIDPVNHLLLKSKTTTKESGTYELLLSYGKYSDYGLPDKVVFSFNTKDYKLPKGITFDFETGNDNKTKTIKSNKGVAELLFSQYKINKGIAESVFK
jgi:outer membrane lipoprotein-sorting protein